MFSLKMAPAGDSVCARVCVGLVNRALTACLVKASFTEFQMLTFLSPAH